MDEEFILYKGLCSTEMIAGFSILIGKVDQLQHEEQCDIDP